MSIRSRALVFTFLVILLPPLSEARRKDVIRIQMGGEPSTLDPSKASDVYAFSILRNVSEGLFKLDAEGKIVNGLASRHEVSKEGLVHRFKLREARWSDGKPVAIEDFIFALRRTLDPKTAAPNAEYFFAVKNAREVYAGKMKLEALGIRRDRDELVIELVHADPLLPLSLTLPAAFPLREDSFRDHGFIWDPSFPVTGDYKISSFKPADEIELTPNPLGATPGRRPVSFKILQEEMTAMNLFDSGRMDVITTLTTSELGPLEKRGLIVKTPSTTIFYLSFNLSNKPLSDLNWRKAIASSFDRDGLARLLNGTYKPATSVVAPSIAGSLPYSPMTDEAAVAQIRAIKKKPRLKMAYGSSAFTKIVAEKIQRDLEKSLDLKLELEPMELKALLGRLRSDPPDLYFLGMSAMFDDPIPQLNGYSSAAGPNFSRYVSSRFERELQAVREAPMGLKRKLAAEEANRTLTERDVAVVPLLLRIQILGVSKGLKGFRISPYSVMQLNGLDK